MEIEKLIIRKKKWKYLQCEIWWKDEIVKKKGVIGQRKKACNWEMEIGYCLQMKIIRNRHWITKEIDYGC